jgi:hypothetical protein
MKKERKKRERKVIKQEETKRMKRVKANLNDTQTTNKRVDGVLSFGAEGLHDEHQCRIRNKHTARNKSTLQKKSRRNSSEEGSSIRFKRVRKRKVKHTRAGVRPRTN